MKIAPSPSTPRLRALQQVRRGNNTSAFTPDVACSDFLELEALNAPQAFAPTSELWAIQEAKQQAPQQRGHTLLASLEALYASTLMDEDPGYGLRELAKSLQAPATACADPRLQQILDEIEQRVAIELAKRGFRNEQL